MGQSSLLSKVSVKPGLAQTRYLRLGKPNNRVDPIYALLRSDWPVWGFKSDWLLGSSSMGGRAWMGSSVLLVVSQQAVQRVFEWAFFDVCTEVRQTLQRAGGQAGFFDRMDVTWQQFGIDADA